jgi:hypothetical protein
MHQVVVVVAELVDQRQNSFVAVDRSLQYCQMHFFQTLFFIIEEEKKRQREKTRTRNKINFYKRKKKKKRISNVTSQVTLYRKMGKGKEVNHFFFQIFALMTSIVPNIPGEFVENTFDLKKQVATLLGLKSYK